MAATTAAELQPVAQVKDRLQALLEVARTIKSTDSVDPPLPVSELSEQVDGIHDGLSEDYDQTYRFAIVETAARQIFYDYISTTDINDSSFTDVWNLLDILLICGDRKQCAPELVCWLIEELLDSQTTTGCRTVFDYLESRRARLAATDFHKKNLVFLRSCNELLRRLSRAEDAIFCGRVFFFLFQMFPLGDKSSVNLRGEFHTENLTLFDELAEGEKMEVDEKPAKAEEDVKEQTPQPPTKPGAKGQSKNQKKDKKTVEEEVLSSSDLYPIFWRLQQDFCEPTRLFTPEHFTVFKKSLASTITKFKKTPTVVQSKASNGDSRGTKRKAGDEDGDAGSKDEFVDNYNPKYLTSRDLFDLEVSDLAFQRHIMVQALILIEFLLSLTQKAKQKLQALDSANKSMLYSFTLSEEDEKWATSTRSTITSFLQSVGDGRFYCRMVETVLARDKNWVRWKVESCPSIVRDPVSTDEELQARKGARSATRVRKFPLRSNGGELNLSFLEEGSGGLEALEDPSRYTEPTIEELVTGIQVDQMDAELEAGKELEDLQSQMSNKRWRAVRQATAKRFSILEKIEPGKPLDPVFLPRPQEEENEDGGNDVAPEEHNGDENGEEHDEEGRTTGEQVETEEENGDEKGEGDDEKEEGGEKIDGKQEEADDGPAPTDAPMTMESETVAE